MIKVGVIGYGGSAKVFHLPLIEGCKGLKLVAISTGQTDGVRSRYPGISIYPTAQELIQQSTAELIIITAPNNVHYDLSRACLEQGKHVVIEKPMVTSVAQARKLAVLAASAQGTLSVFHNRRWDGDFLTVKKVLERGSLGQLRVFESHFDRYRPSVPQRWRDQPGEGTGVWFDLGAHLLDQVVCLFGPPDAVTGRCLPLRDNSQVSDYFHVQLHYSSCEVILHASPFCAGPNQRFHLQGTEGSFIKFGMDPQEDQLKEGLALSHAQFGYEDAEYYGRLYTGEGYRTVATERGCYSGYYDQICEAIHLGTEPPVGIDAGVSNIELLALAQLSSEQGKTLVYKPVNSMNR